MNKQASAAVRRPNLNDDMRRTIAKTKAKAALGFSKQALLFHGHVEKVRGDGSSVTGSRCIVQVRNSPVYLVGTLRQRLLPHVAETKRRFEMPVLNARLGEMVLASVVP